MWRVRSVLGAMIVLACAIAGAGLLAYPVVMTHWNNNRQLSLAREYEESNKNLSEAELSDYLLRAHAYNEALIAGPLRDPWSGMELTEDVSYRNYLSVLNNQTVMARLVIPGIGVDLPVFHGSGDDALRSGVGHLYGSQLPVGGVGTHAVLTGHTGASSATLFDHLVDMKMDDPFYVSVGGEHLKYEVSAIDVVLPHETEKLLPVPGEDLITLVTCTPYGSNTHRLFVTGHRVPMDEDDVTSPVRNVLEGRMFILAGVVAMILAAVLFIVVRRLVRSVTVNTSRSARRSRPR